MSLAPLRKLGSLLLACGASLALLATPLSHAQPVESLSSATGGLWSEAATPTTSAGARSAVPLKYRLVTLDGALFNALAGTAPKEEATPARSSEVIVALPLPDGGVARFRIVETAVMAPELAAQFPDIRTWLGYDVDDPSSTVRLDWTPLGFHAMVLSAARGRFFIDPWSLGDTQNYLAYYSRDYVPPPGSRTRLMPPVDVIGKAAAKSLAQGLGGTAQKSSGTQLRTYRLAVAATVEYTAKFGGTVPNGQAAIVTAINRVNGIYETEVAVRMQLVANNSSLVYTSAPDPYTNDDGEAMLGQNQANVTAVIGSANYDIGHVFSTGGGGIAGLGVVCSAGNKARGVTGSSNPVGDGFYVDYVAHEIGHQFSGNHSFNGNADNCGGGNRNASTAYEPGSGSTIMAYAGICGTQDLQANSDPYFHSVSFDEIVTFTTEGGGSACGQSAATGNTLPTATVPPGGFTIPARTPFALTGSGGDADGDSITYNWEEYDLGNAGAPGRDTVAPFFRSWPSSTGPTRIFPRLSNLLAGTLAAGEVLPNATRTLNFRMTVRDNRAGGGGVVYAPFAFNVTAAAGPFQVTAPNTNVSWPGGTAQTVTWNVANTASAPVSCANVDILLSTDGGNTYPTVLVAATSNDGSAGIVLPAVSSTTARVMVACSTSIFFDISNTNFTIGAAAPGPTVTTGSASAITATGATLNGTVSSNGATSTVTFDYGTSVSYGASAVAAQSPLASGASNAAVSAAVTGLTCNTLYHFRAAGTNANGAVNGADATFTTNACTLAPTNTSVASSANPVVGGNPVTFTATINGTAPTGTVTFRDGGSTIGGCAAVALTGSGNTRGAACVAGNLTVGTHSITARYNGDAGNAASTSPALSQVVQDVVPSVATIVANPYGSVTVTGATLNGNTISNFTTDVVIEMGGTPGAPNAFAQIDFPGGLAIGAGSTVTVRAGAAGQTVLVRNSGGTASLIGGVLRSQGAGAVPPPVLRVADPNGLQVFGAVVGPGGLEVSTLGATPLQGQLLQNQGGVIDGGPSLVVNAAGIRGGGKFIGNAIRLGTFGNANNPVNGNDFLANGLQLHPSTGEAVALTLNAYGTGPQVFNLEINGNGTVWMPSSWPGGSTLPQNNNPLAPDGVRPPGTPAPSFGGGSMILQATGGLALVDGGTHDFVFPGAIVLKSGGALDLNGVLVNQGWTGNGQTFQGIFLEAPAILSAAGNIRLYTNFPNWVNFSTLPQTPVRAFTLARQPDNSERFVAADDSVPHQNTYSVIQGIAAAGGCWLCAVNTQPVNVYGP